MKSCGPYVVNKICEGITPSGEMSIEVPFLRRLPSRQNTSFRPYKLRPLTSEKKENQNDLTLNSHFTVKTSDSCL